MIRKWSHYSQPFIKSINTGRKTYKIYNQITKPQKIIEYSNFSKHTLKWWENIYIDEYLC